MLGGRKVAVSRPRVRGVAGGEVSLPIWAAFAGEELLADQTMASLLAGVSTRNYDKTLEPVGALDASATSRSAVSRRFVARTAKALDELMAKDLSELRVCALFVDGICESEHMMVCAIGLDTQGRKHLLGLREGTTENKAVCAGLLSDLVGRGLDFSGGILAVLDGGKGLRAAVKEVFGNLGVVQRCRAHKRRNVLDHLPKEAQPVVKKAKQDAKVVDPDELERKGPPPYSAEYETITLPALQRMSGITNISSQRVSRTRSASGVVGPLAASARIRHLSWLAFFPVMTRSTAAGMRMSHGNVRNSFGST